MIKFALLFFTSFHIYGQSFSTGSINSKNIDEVFVNSETIVVTGTKTEKSSVDAPVKTEVFTDKQIEDLHLRSVDEVIPFIPGVTLQDNRGREGKSAIIQGMSGSKVMVLIDGVPVIQTTNTGVDLTKISTQNIEQIEVVKGAASSLYGSQAMGGVINIITKKSDRRLSLTANMQTGVFNDDQTTGETDLPANTSITANGKEKRFDYQFDFSRRAREGVELDEASVLNDGSEFEKYQAMATLGYQYRKKDRAAIRYRYEYDRNLSRASQPRGTTGLYDLKENSSKARNQSWYLLGENHYGDSKLSYTYTYQRVNDENLQLDDPTTIFPEEQRTSLFQMNRGEFQFDTVAFGNHLLTTGIVISTLSLDQDKRDYESLETFTDKKEIEKKYLRSYEAYIQDNIVWDEFELVVGTRGQYDSDFGTQVSPKISSIYSPNLIEGTRTQLRSSVGTGYRVPELKEKYYLLDHSSIGYQLLGNENLNPEESISFQLGPEIISKKYGSLSVNFFYNRIKNLIVFQEVGSIGPIQQFTYINAESAESRGYEVDYSVSFLDRSYFTQNFTYSETINTETGLYIPNRPLYNLQSIVGLGLTQKLTWVNTFNYDGNEYATTDNTEVAAGFTTYNTKINYAPSKNLNLEFGVNNIFDETRDALGDQIQATEDNSIRVQDKRPLIGRYLYFGLTIKS